MTEQTEIKVQTKAFGEVNIQKAQCIHLPDGLFGFNDRQNYALLDAGPNSYFKWLQDLDKPELAFVVIQPEHIFADYKPNVPAEELKEIDIESDDDMLIFVLVTIPENSPQEMTANLQGPIIINRRNKKARQMISQAEGHSVRVPILTYLEND